MSWTSLLLLTPNESALNQLHLFSFPYIPTQPQNPNLRFRFLLRLITDIPESTIAVAAGMILGLLLSKIFNIRTRFSQEVFFYFILPPIIFYQG